METEGAPLTNTTGLWPIKVETHDATDEPQVWYVVKREDDHESEEGLRSADSLQDNTLSQGMPDDGTLPKHDWKTEEKYTPHQQPSSAVCRTTVGTKTMYDSVVGSLRPSTEPVRKSEREIIPNNGQLSQNVKTEPIEADVLECGTGTCPQTVESDVAISETHTAEMASAMLQFGSSTAHIDSSTPDAWHIEENPLLCEICGICLKYPSKLRRHMRIHTGERPHTCDMCGKSFTEAFALKNHRYNHLDVKPYICEVCGKSFSSSSHSNYHLIHVEGRGEADMLECGTGTFPETIEPDVTNFETHTAERASAMPQFGSSTTHIDSSTPDAWHIEENPLLCEICGICLKYPSKLRRHMRIHTGERPHTCDICDKSFTEAFALKNHRYSHLDVKPYICEVCGKRFSSSSHLNYHLIHVEGKGFSCNVCGKSFKLMLTLKRHRAIHTGVKPHVCKVCSKSFTQISQLKSHIRIHTREISYSCEICCQTFTNSYSLNNHGRTHKRQKRQEEEVRQLEETGQQINAEQQTAEVSDVTDKAASHSNRVRGKCQTILSLLRSDSASNLSQKGKVFSLER
ncbi:zinc finger protein 883-like [Liolophura sinensis]|uniref:zinc finger protein 883-like n=1 Tax=Liolophura sinensis TaxID=3198878 RepID=UPI0031598FA5